MDGQEAVQGLTLAELGGLNNNHSNSNNNNNDDNSNSSNNDDAESSQGSSALMRAGDEKVAESLQGSGALMRAGDEKVVESSQGSGALMRAGVAVEKDADAARSVALDVIDTAATAVTYPNDVRGGVGVEVVEHKTAPATAPAPAAAAPAAAVAAVTHTTGGDSVQGAWSAFAMAVVAIALLVCGVGITRSVHPLTPLRTHS